MVGVNLEDSIVISDNREIVDENEFSETIKSIKYDLKEKEIEVFLNIRTDCFITGLENALTQTIMRSALYEAAGRTDYLFPV